MKPARFAHLPDEVRQARPASTDRAAPPWSTGTCAGARARSGCRGGTGICLVRGWSMPTVSTRPPNRLRRDVVDVHRAAGDRLALHRELEQLELRAAALAAARCPPPPRRPPRPPSRRARSRAGCPSRSSSRSRSRGRRLGAGSCSAWPAVLRAASSGSSVRDAGDRRDAHAAARACARRARGRRSPRPCGRGCRSRCRRCRPWPARTPWRCCASCHFGCGLQIWAPR